jgi:hypothetical protein
MNTINYQEGKCANCGRAPVSIGIPVFRESNDYQQGLRIDNNYALSLSQLDDIVVTNRHSRSEGGYTSYSVGGGRRGGIRVGMGQGRGRSRPYGDVVFFVNGQAVLTFYEVEDPSGLVRLIKVSKKGRFS